MVDVNIWSLLDIHDLERVLSERLALKTAELAQQMKSKKYGFIFGPLGSEWDKRLRKSKEIEELNALREFLITVKEAKKAGMQCCQAYECEAHNLVDEKISKYQNRFDNFEEKSDYSKNSALLCTFLDLFEKIYKPNENEALYKAVNNMKKLNEEVTRETQK